MLKEFERIVIDEMIANSVIPKDIFQINDNILNEYIKIYGKIFNKKNKGLIRKNQYRFARRLAGLTLLKVNYQYGAKFNDIDSGLVYIISNPIYQDHYKIGMTLDLNTRLNQYQTYDPFRRFKIEKYDFVLNRKDVEKQILQHPNITNESGEWILKENAIEIFERICFYSGVAQ